MGLSYALLGSNGLIHLAKVVATNEAMVSVEHAHHDHGMFAQYCYTKNDDLKLDISI